MRVESPPQRRCSGTQLRAAEMPCHAWPVRMIQGSVDEPDGLNPVGPSALWIRGWAYDPEDPVVRVEVWLGDHNMGPAGLGRPRPDVAAALGDPEAGLAGFELHCLVPAGMTRGDVKLRVAVLLLDGTRVYLRPRALRLQPSSAPPAPLADESPPTCRQRRIHRSLRVLWSVHGLGRGGSQLRISEVIGHLSRSRHSQTVLSPDDGPLRDALAAAGAEVRIAPRIPLDDPAAYERSVADLCGWIEDRFDVVVATTASFPAVDAAARLGVPSILRVGESAPLPTVVAWVFGELDPQVERRARFAVKNASLVVTNSAEAVRIYRSQGWEGRYLILPTGIDVREADDARRTLHRAACRLRLGVGAGERLLVCAGTLWPVKGQATLVRAIDLVRRQGLLVSSALVGDADPEYERAISAYVARRGLNETVRIIPFRDDLRWWWRAADAAVCPSETEGFPAAVVEAMAHGLPVLGTRVGAIPDLVVPGVTGWLCQPSDLRSLAEALFAVAVTPAETLRAMGAAAAGAARPYDRALALDRMADLVRQTAHGALPGWARLLVQGEPAAAPPRWGGRLRRPWSRSAGTATQGPEPGIRP